MLKNIIKYKGTAFFAGILLSTQLCLGVEPSGKHAASASLLAIEMITAAEIIQHAFDLAIKEWFASSEDRDNEGDADFDVEAEEVKEEEPEEEADEAPSENEIAVFIKAFKEARLVHQVSAYDLPSEMLAAIFKYVKNIKDLESVALTNKRWRAWAQEEIKKRVERIREMADAEDPSQRLQALKAIESLIGLSKASLDDVIKILNILKKDEKIDVRKALVGTIRTFLGSKKIPKEEKGLLWALLEGLAVDVQPMVRRAVVTEIGALLQNGKVSPSDRALLWGFMEGLAKDPDNFTRRDVAKAIQLIIADEKALQAARNEVFELLERLILDAILVPRMAARNAIENCLENEKLSHEDRMQLEWILTLEGLPQFEFQEETDSFGPIRGFTYIWAESNTGRSSYERDGYSYEY